MGTNSSFLDSLSKRIVQEKELASICSLCSDLFSALYKRGAKEILSDSSNGKEVQEKCHLLREALDQAGITEEFSDEDLCKLAHKVFETKLLRGV